MWIVSAVNSGSKTDSLCIADEVDGGGFRAGEDLGWTTAKWRRIIGTVEALLGCWGGFVGRHGRGSLRFEFS